MKSFLTAVFCCCRAILYPNSKIILAGGNKRQSSNIITEKIEDLRSLSPTLDKEILKIQTYHENVCCVFRNGSRIIATTSTEGSRSARGNVLVCDEYRMIKENIINTVLKQFLTNPRKPPFLDKPEYKDYPLEPNIEVYLSSAFLKSHWSYEKFMTALNGMLEGKKSFACDIPYLASLDHKLVLKEKIDEDREQIGEWNFQMEYCGIWYGTSENSFYKANEINNCRVLNKAYYPLTDNQYRDPEEKKKKLKQMPKKKGEIRIIGVDVAVQKSSKTNNNDNSVYTLMRLLPNANGYIREIVYIESWNGLKVEKQANRIKRLYTEFQADKIIIDGNGVGFSVIEEMQKSSYDETIDEHYEPFGVYDCNVNSDFDPLKNGNNCIYMMKAYERTNSQVAVGLKNAFASKKIRLLIDENEKKSDFSNNKKFNQDGEFQAEMLTPFIQCSMFIYETLNLEYEVRPNGNIAVKEIGKNRKDRFSSVAYANFLADEIEREYIKKSRKNKSKFIFIT